MWGQIQNRGLHLRATGGDDGLEGAAGGSAHLEVKPPRPWRKRTNQKFLSEHFLDKPKQSGPVLQDDDLRYFVLLKNYGNGQKLKWFICSYAKAGYATEPLLV